MRFRVALPVRLTSRNLVEDTAAGSLLAEFVVPRGQSYGRPRAWINHTLGRPRQVPPSRAASPPKDDAGYFDQMSKAIFTAGLNWRMIDNKWPNFRKAFDGFSPARVAKFNSKDVQRLMNDPGIVRNEKKIWATIQNAGTLLDLQKEFGSVKEYIGGFGKKEKLLQEDLQLRFKFMGPSTARMFLWMVGYSLTPTREEAMWMKGHRGHGQESVGRKSAKAVP